MRHTCLTPSVGVLCVTHLLAVERYFFIDPSLTGCMAEIYMAGPMDRPADDGRGWRNFLAETYPVFDWLNPLDEHDPVHNPSPTDRAIVNDDKDMIFRADGMIINITDLSELNWGTQQEQMLAFIHAIPNVVVYRGDRAELSPWCREHATYIATSLEEATFVLHEMLYHRPYPNVRPLSTSDYYSPYEAEAAHV